MSVRIVKRAAPVVVLCESRPAIRQDFLRFREKTSVPGVITAGTFYQDGRRIFWDVHHPKKTIVIDLHDERCNELIVEVADPEAAVRLIENALCSCDVATGDSRAQLSPSIDEFPRREHGCTGWKEFGDEALMESRVEVGTAVPDDCQTKIGVSSFEES